MLGGVVTEALLNFGDVLGFFEIDSAKAQRAVHKVDVAIDETGEDELTGGIDDFGPGMAEFFDGGVVADGNNFVGADGDGLSPRLLGVEGVDAAVKDDGV